MVDAASSFVLPSSTAGPLAKVGKAHSDIQTSFLRSALSALAPISDSAWSAAVPFFFTKHFPAGKDVVQAGTVVTDLFFVTSGLARYYYIDKQGKEFNKSFSMPGQVLSSVVSLVARKPSPFFIQTLVPCECVGISYRNFVELAHRYADWSLVRTSLLEQLVIKKERREADFLLLTPAERYKEFLRDYPQVAEVVPNYHIASYLGITEVALSRIRRRLGLIRVNDVE